MNEQRRHRHSWDSRPYMSIKSAHFDGDALHVCFEDGACVSVAVAQLLHEGEPSPDWARLSFDEHEIVAPGAEAPVEVSWLSIRLLTDPAFNAYWAAKAADYRKRTGERLAALRERRGVDREELARRAGLPLERLIEIENGEVSASYSTLEQILAPLGFTLDDLWPARAVEPAQTNAAPVSA